MKISITKIIFLALTLILIPTAAGAQTPDGETPAVENYCDKYADDGHKYAICNAYYEAMDCNQSPKASSVACTKLAAMLEALGVEASSSGGTTVPCPCFDDLETLFSGLDPVCSPGENPTLISDNGVQVQATVNTDFEFYACVGDKATRWDLSFEEASSCLNQIEKFCAGL